MAKAAKLTPSMDDFDLGGLEQFDLTGLGKKGAVATVEAPSGKPSMISTDLIYEDAAQPRGEDNPGFSEESLNEMAESIRASGVKQPIIVRSKDETGKHKICDGARRYRGTLRTELREIPYIIDDDFDRTTQLMVNLQRVDNTPDEIARGIAELEEKGVSRADIARGMGMSKAFVTEHAKFAAINPLVRSLYENGECRDVTLCNRLDDLLKKYPDAVRTFVTSGAAINRRTVDSLKIQVSDAQAGGAEKPADAARNSEAQGEASKASSKPASAEAKVEHPGVGKGKAQANQAHDEKQAPAGAGQANANEEEEGKGAWPFKPREPEKAAAPAAGSTGEQAPSEAEQDAAAIGKQAPTIAGLYAGQEVVLVLDKQAAQAKCWVKSQDGVESEIECSEFTLTGVAV